MVLGRWLGHEGKDLVNGLSEMLQSSLPMMPGGDVVTWCWQL